MMRSGFLAAVFALIASASGLVNNYDPSVHVAALKERNEAFYNCTGAYFGEKYVSLVQRRACMFLQQSMNERYYPRRTHLVPFLDLRPYYRFPLLQFERLHEGYSKKTEDYFILIGKKCDFTGVTKRILSGPRIRMPRTPSYEKCEYTAAVNSPTPSQTAPKAIDNKTKARKKYYAAEPEEIFW